MGIEDDFYATIKFKSGEEIFSKVAASEEDDRTMLILSHPINVIEVKGRKGDPLGYKMEPWLKTTKDSLFIIDIDDILSLSENTDLEMISMYEQFNNYNGDEPMKMKKTASRKMGYLSNVDDAKKSLEKLYNNS